MKKIFFTLLFILLTSVVFAQGTKIEYRMPINTKLNFKERINTNITTTIMGEKVSEAKNEIEMTIKENVIESNDNTFKSKQSVSITKYISDGENALDDLEEDVDNTVIYEMTKNGKIVFLGDKDGKKQDDFELDEEEYLFPVKPIKVGDIWKCKRNIDGKKVNMTCKLEKLYSQDGVDIAKIKMDVDDKISQTDEETNEKCEIFIKGGGYYYFAINFGNDLYMNYNIEFKTKIDTMYEDKPVSLEIINKYDYKYWRCE